MRSSVQVLPARIQYPFLVNAALTVKVSSYDWWWHTTMISSFLFSLPLYSTLFCILTVLFILSRLLNEPGMLIIPFLPSFITTLPFLPMSSPSRLFSPLSLSFRIQLLLSRLPRSFASTFFPSLSFFPLTFSTRVILNFIPISQEMLMGRKTYQWMGWWIQVTLHQKVDVTLKETRESILLELNGILIFHPLDLICVPHALVWLIHLS